LKLAQGWCSIRLGTFESDEKWTTNSRETVKQYFYLTQSDQQEACAKQMNVVRSVLACSDTKKPNYSYGESR
jgi:hypothetical protein